MYVICEYVNESQGTDINMNLSDNIHNKRTATSLSDSLTQIKSSYVGTYWVNNEYACQNEKAPILAINSLNNTRLCRS